MYLEHGSSRLLAGFSGSWEALGNNLSYTSKSPLFNVLQSPRIKKSDAAAPFVFLCTQKYASTAPHTAHLRGSLVLGNNLSYTSKSPLFNVLQSPRIKKK